MGREESKMKWISVEDYLPDFMRVLILIEMSNIKVIDIGYYDNVNGWMCKGEKVPVTYWMPLLKPPKD